jgi:hypothetical protein
MIFDFQLEILRAIERGVTSLPVLVYTYSNGSLVDLLNENLITEYLNEGVHYKLTFKGRMQLAVAATEQP